MPWPSVMGSQHDDVSFRNGYWRLFERLCGLVCSHQGLGMAMIWALIPAWLKRAVAWALAGLVAIGGAWAIGRRDGATAARNKAVQKRLDEMQKAKDTRDEVDSISGDDVSGRLHKWNRK